MTRLCNISHLFWIPSLKILFGRLVLFRSHLAHNNFAMRCRGSCPPVSYFVDFQEIGEFWKEITIFSSWSNWNQTQNEPYSQLKGRVVVELGQHFQGQNIFYHIPSLTATVEFNHQHWWKSLFMTSKCTVRLIRLTLSSLVKAWLYYNAHPTICWLHYHHTCQRMMTSFYHPYQQILPMLIMIAIVLSSLTALLTMQILKY